MIVGKYKFFITLILIQGITKSSENIDSLVERPLKIFEDFVNQSNDEINDELQRRMREIFNKESDIKDLEKVLTDYLTDYVSFDFKKNRDIVTFPLNLD